MNLGYSVFFAFILGLVGIVMLSCGRDDTFVPMVPVPPNQGEFSTSNLREYGDILRNDINADPRYREILTDPSFTPITNESGKSVVKTNQGFPIHSEIASSQNLPWSSWWFPAREKTLFADRDGRNSSPLAKYDIYRKSELGRGNDDYLSAVEYGEKSYNPNALAWEGLCDAWAIASIASREPVNPVKVKTRFLGSSIVFSVGDLKALLLISYEGTEDSGLTYYGQKFTGDVDGWIYPDIFPEQFHRFIEVQLLRDRKPFIIDHDPGPEVWNVPVFKANFIMNQIPGKPNSLFVRTWIVSAESYSIEEIDLTGTKEAIREYNYVLEGSRNSAGDLVIDSGYWVVGPNGIDSRRDHPDYLIKIKDPSKLVRKSRNPAINVELVDKLVSQSILAD